MLLIIIIIIILVVGSKKRKKIGNKATRYFTVAAVLSVLNVLMEITNYLRLISTINQYKNNLSDDQIMNTMVVTTLVIIAEIGLLVACFKMRNETKLIKMPDPTNHSSKKVMPETNDEDVDTFAEPKTKPKAKKTSSKSKTTSRAEKGDAEVINAFFSEEIEDPDIAAAKEMLERSDTDGEDDEESKNSDYDYAVVADEIYEISMKFKEDLADRLSDETGLSKSNEQVAGPSRGFAKMFFNLGARTLADRLDEIDGDIDELAEIFADKRGDVTPEVIKNYTKLPQSEIKELRRTFETMEDETGIPTRQYLQEIEDAIENFLNQEI